MTIGAKQADSAQTARQEKLPAHFLGGWKMSKNVGL